MSEPTDALREEIAFLKQQLDACAEGITEQKYLQQAKQARDLSVKLDSERARVQKLQAQIIKHERESAERNEAEKKGVLLPSAAAAAAGGPKSAAAMEAAHAQQQVADLRHKLDKALSQAASLRAQCDKHDKDMARIRKVLLLEIGDEAAVERALAGVADSTQQQSQQQSQAANQAQHQEGAFRGRAQQISLLQAKVKDLTRKLNDASTIAPSSHAGGDGVSVVGSAYVNNTNNDLDGSGTVRTAATGVTSATRDFDAVHRNTLAQQENRRHAETRQQQQLLDEARENASKEKQRADGFASRVQVLERQAQQLRASLQQVIQKTENDDQLVSAYKAELDVQRAEIRQLQKNLEKAGFVALGNNNNGNNGNISSSNMSSARGAASGYDGNSPNPEVARLQHQVRTQETEIETLRRQVAMMIQTTSANPSSSAATTSMQRDEALAIVESQRKMILSLEQRLQSLEALESQNGLSAFIAKYGSGASAVVQALRDENSSLKERIRAMTQMVEKEIALKTAQLTAQMQQRQPQPQSQQQQHQTQQVAAVRGAAIGNVVSAPPPAQIEQPQQQQQQSNQNVVRAPVRSSRPPMNFSSAGSASATAASSGNSPIAEPPRNVVRNDDDHDDSSDDEHDGRRDFGRAANSGIAMPLSLRGLQ